ncbi:MAG: asparaginase [Ilumatobacteraceae bacterium]
MTHADLCAPIAVTTRSGMRESLHHGTVVALDNDGSVAFSVGDPSVVTYPRSANKPMQAVAMVDAGLQLPGELLALVCASHDGTPYHRDIASRILAGAGLDASALQNTPDLPIDRVSADAIIRADGGPTSLQQNCSGKHSGMVATCVINGWSLDGYLDVSHPLQQVITATIQAMADEPITQIGIDGCGAPAHAMSLLGLARSFRSIAIAPTDSPNGQVYAAMTGYPLTVGGNHRDVTQFIRHVPGLIAKDGAEGVFAAALPDGRTVAMKVADGASRAVPAVMVHALQRLGVDVRTLDPLVRKQILGHGAQVGHVESIAQFIVAAAGGRA